MQTPHELRRGQRARLLAGAGCRAQSAFYLGDDDISVRMVPTLSSVAAIAVAIQIRPASTAVAPASCRMTRETRVFMLAPDRHWLRENGLSSLPWPEIYQQVVNKRENDHRSKSRGPQQSLRPLR